MGKLWYIDTEVLVDAVVRKISWYIDAEELGDAVNRENCGISMQRGRVMLIRGENIISMQKVG